MKRGNRDGERWRRDEEEVERDGGNTERRRKVERNGVEMKR